MTRRIGELLAAAQISFTNECEADLEISDLCADSRAVSAGALFCAWPGMTVDGRDYISQAVAKGAVAIVCEEEGFEAPDACAVPIIRVAGLQRRLGQLADEFFAQPSSDLQVFGVTGTNGKTTCCYLLAQTFANMGMQSAVIGTLGYGPIDRLQPTSHTTPDAISVHRQLAELRDAGVTQVCMEVSSHALDQGRVNGVRFYSTLFTNLSHDHLDYHGDMQTYGFAKQRLFTDFASELAVINANDELGSNLLDVANSGFIVSYGKSGDVAAEDVQAAHEGLRFHVEANGVDFEISSALIGLVNVPNLELVVATLLSLSTPIEEIQTLVADLKPAPGRMDLISTAGAAKVVVDYAHTPDALEKALQSVREHCNGQLWCVFGCGGDRDQDKRPIMGQIAAANADRLIVTNDNPRSEDPEFIAQQIASELDSGVSIILDRAAAIKAAISEASTDDWILVAGKGHESTQTIGEEVLPFSDIEQVAAALGVAA